MAITKKEFFQLFKSVKSIIMIVVLLVSSYYFAKYTEQLVPILKLEQTSSWYAGGLLIILLLFGPLFVMSLSHDVLNRELSERTMRFLVTKTSKANILFGKFLGVWIFWFVCFTVCYVITLFYSKSFDGRLFLETVSLLTYLVVITLLLSIVIKSPQYTMFIGVIFGMAFSIFQMVILESTAWYSYLKYLMPLFYMQDEDFKFLIVFLQAAVMYSMTYFIFKRTDC